MVRVNQKDTGTIYRTLDMGVDGILAPNIAGRDEAEQVYLSSLAPDYLIVAAYGMILPQSVLDIPAREPINVHTSLLPAYRGSAPVQRALMNGETRTGVTTMLTDKGMDTGDMLLSARTPIGIRFENLPAAPTAQKRPSPQGAMPETSGPSR